MKKTINNPMFYKTRKLRRYIYTFKPLSKKTNRTKRKAIAREIKECLKLDKIPGATYDSLVIYRNFFNRG